MLILAGLWVQQKIPAHIGDFFVFPPLKKGCLLAGLALGELFWIDRASHWLIPVVVADCATILGCFWHFGNPPFFILCVCNLY